MSRTRARNTISGFKIGGAAGTLTPIAGSPLLPAIAASAVVADPTSIFAYAANANANTVSAYTLDPKSGALTALSGSPFTHRIDSGRDGDQRLTSAAEPCRQAATACTLYCKGAASEK